MLPIKFRFIWQSGFRGEYLKKSTNQKQELLLVAMFVYGSGRNWQSSQRTCHSFGSFGQTVSEEKNLKNHPIRNKNRLWRPCLLMDWEKFSRKAAIRPIVRKIRYMKMLRKRCLKAVIFVLKSH